MTVSTAIDWDQWRANYTRMTFAEHQAFNQKVADLHPVQASCRAFLDEFRPGSVAEIGGWDGALAALMLSECDFIDEWVNYDITDVPQTCVDARYSQVVLDDWPWNTNVTADALIASHVFEHMLGSEAMMTLSTWNINHVFVDCPIGTSAQSWDGYHGSHIIDVGSTELLKRLGDIGYRTVFADPVGSLVAYLQKDCS